MTTTVLLGVLVVAAALEGLERAPRPSSAPAARLALVLSAPCGQPPDHGGCALLDAVGADLARTPLRHELRLLRLDPGGPPRQLEATEAADPANPAEADAADTVGSGGGGAGLAHLHLLVGGERPTVFLGPATPAWLVYAVLAAGRAAGVACGVAPRSPLAQLAERLVAAPAPSSEAVPTIFLGGDPAALATLAAATVRRLDGLASAPRDDRRYLVIGGRVFGRRDLLWLGFVLWAMQVLGGRPGRWLGASGEERRQAGHHFLPAFVYRLAFLLAFLLEPAIAAVVLLPAALLRWARAGSARLRVAIGLLPAIALLLVVALRLDSAGEISPAALSPLLPPLTALAAFAWSTLRPMAGPRPP